MDGDPQGMAPAGSSSRNARNRALRRRYLRLESASLPAGSSARPQLETVVSEFVATNEVLVEGVLARGGIGACSECRDLIREAARTAIRKQFLCWDPDRAAFTSWALAAVSDAASRAAARLDACEHPDPGTCA